jgi:catechol 2,3-dioxygenase-like lactoylglutathione lyase family enzyme
MVEKISAITLRVANMRESVRFYNDVLELEIIYGGEGSCFTSFRTKDGSAILNLEHGDPGTQWGRLIFHVSDVDRFWAYLTEKGFHPKSRRALPSACVNVELQKRHPRPGRVDVFAHITLLMQTGELDQAS